MNRAAIGLGLLAGLMMLILTVAGVWFVADAAYLALAAHMNPWAAALITGGLMLLPLLASIGLLLWSAYRRRLRQQRRLGALQAAFAGAVKADPYGFIGAAFMSGMMMSVSPATKQKITECMAMCKGMHTSS